MQVNGIGFEEDADDTDLLPDDLESSVEYRPSYFGLLGFLILKELMVYFICVRRAQYKLNKEAEYEERKASTLDNYVKVWKFFNIKLTRLEYD